jgi:hypothetical protein
MVSLLVELVNVNICSRRAGTLGKDGAVGLQGPKDER